MSVLRYFERSTKSNASLNVTPLLWAFLRPAIHDISNSKTSLQRRKLCMSTSRRPNAISSTTEQVESVVVSAHIRTGRCYRQFKRDSHFFDQSGFNPKKYQAKNYLDSRNRAKTQWQRKELTLEQLAEKEEAETLETWASDSVGNAQDWAPLDDLKSIVDTYGQLSTADGSHSTIDGDPLLHAAEVNYNQARRLGADMPDIRLGTGTLGSQDPVAGRDAVDRLELEYINQGAEPTTSQETVSIRRYGRNGSQLTKVDLHLWSKIERLRLILRVRDPSTIPHDQLFDAYIDVPIPRISYLSDWEAHRLTSAFSWVYRRSQVSLIRYLAVLDELRTAGRVIKTDQWTTAVHMSAYWRKICTSQSVDSALEMWRQMEVHAGVPANVVTFTILYSVAAKAGQFSLADMIFREMVSRKIKVDRMVRLARIFYHGLRGDSDAVRHGYTRLVDAGEIIDTAALNCVISAFLNAGEPSSAEHVFQKMKQYHAERLGDTKPPESWKEQRKIRTIISRSTEMWRSNREAMESIQNAAPIAPDTRTYDTLIHFYAREAGNIDRVFALIHEMKSSGLLPTQRTYASTFRGFFHHGGVRYSSWTLEKLEDVWAMFLSDVERRPDVFGSFSASDFSFLAFLQCANVKRCREIRRELEARWWVPDNQQASWGRFLNLKERGLQWNLKYS